VNQKKGKSKRNTHKRKILKARSSDQAGANEDDQEDEVVPKQNSGAGSQFGANGNKKTKKGGH
jgi:hypothetical protein